MRVIGLGLNATADRAAVRAALTAAGPADLLAVLAARADHPALGAPGLPLMALPEAALAGIATPTQSPRIVARFGCGSVAEACAVIASGGRITHARQTLGAVTWAVAEGPGPQKGSAG